MKTLKRPALLVFSAIFIAFLTACSPKQVAAEEVAPAPVDISLGLSKLGFHIFPEPIPLPPFTIPALDKLNKTGATLASGDLGGTITLLNFWATWCPPCKKEMPSIERLSGLMAGKDFRIVAISTGETRKTVETFIAKEKYTFPVYLDEKGTLGASFASQGIPTTYILNKKGHIYAAIVGSTEYDEPSLVAILKAMAAE